MCLLEAVGTGLAISPSCATWNGKCGMGCLPKENRQTDSRVRGIDAKLAEMCMSSAVRAPTGLEN